MTRILLAVAIASLLVACDQSSQNQPAPKAPATPPAAAAQDPKADAAKQINESNAESELSKLEDEIKAEPTP